MEPYAAQMDANFKARVQIARETSPDEKIRAGLRLFEMRCWYMKQEIRGEFPQLDENRVQEILIERLDSRRRMDEGILYQEVTFVNVG
jgi:hypothetical protein